MGYQTSFISVVIESGVPEFASIKEHRSANLLGSTENVI